MLDMLKDGLQLPGASPAEIAACEAALGIRLPEDYRAFLQASNGFNDDVGSGYLVLWSLDGLAGAGGYELFAIQPDRFLIGSNGGPTAYGIIDGNYVSIPFVFAGPWQDEVRILGGSFTAFVAAIAAGEGY